MFDLQADLIGIFIFFIGLCFGSFANVVIYRMPLGKSVVKPRSACGSCGSTLKWHDLIPIASWILLKGRCRNCKNKIAFRYPLVELLTGIAFFAIYQFFGLGFAALEYVLFVYALIIVSFIDLDHMILPDEFTLGGILVGLAGSFLSPHRSFIESLLGVVLGGGFLWAIAAIYQALRKQEGMGGGDIKLLAWIGAVLGWKAIPFVILASSLVGSLVGLCIAVLLKKNLKTAIPFGPYLAFGAVLYLFGGQDLADGYIRIFLPGLP